VKIFLVILGSLLLAGGVVVGIAMKVRSALAPPPTTPVVRTEPAAPGDLVEIISAPGEVQPRTKVSISARVSAAIIDLPFKEGDRVTKGDPARHIPASVLVRLDARDVEAALQSANARHDAQVAQIEVAKQHIKSSAAQIVSAKANLLDAQRDFDRQKGLLSTSDVSQSIVDTAETKADSMKAQIEASQFSLAADQANLVVMDEQLKASKADVDKAKDDLSYTVIVATIDGIVTRRKAEVGEVVVPGIQGSPGTTIMEVADLSQMLMVARIDESSIAQVKAGQTAHVRMQAFADKIFDGVVETVANARAQPDNNQMSPGNSDNGRYFECHIRLDTKGQNVRSGLSADADIEVHRHHGIRVASQAVMGRPTESLPAGIRSNPEVDVTKSITSVVYRVVNGKAAATPVTVGPSDETHTLIKSGLKDGDAIIIGPYKVLETLADGQAVNVEAGQAKAAGKAGRAPVSATAPTTMPATAPGGN